MTSRLVAKARYVSLPLSVSATRTCLRPSTFSVVISPSFTMRSSRASVVGGWRNSRRDISAGVAGTPSFSSVPENPEHSSLHRRDAQSLYLPVPQANHRVSQLVQETPELMLLFRTQDRPILEIRRRCGRLLMCFSSSVCLSPDVTSRHPKTLYIDIDLLVY